jgi:hypothetical protein
LEGHVPTSEANPPYGSPGWDKAEIAFQRIGTNGIPTLVKMIEAKELPPLMIKAMEWGEQHGLIQRDYHTAYAQNEEAEYAFSVLGTNAASAVPQLIRIYQKNVSPSSQRCAALALGHIRHAAEPAVPILISNFRHTNSDVRFHAVTAVAKIGGRTELVMPNLLSALKDPNVNVRWNAVYGLAPYGRAVVTNLLELLNDPGMVGTSSMAQYLARTIWHIAPEKVGQPLIVQDPTSIITTNGVTSEALKVLFHGERKTLIAAGKRVPAVAQYWSSDPRPGLTVYRGPESGGQDQLLGKFEVMDVEDSGTVNISTLLVVADGKIVICARDNTHERFLEIRKVE